MRRSSEGLIAPRAALLQNVRRPRAKPVGAAPSRRCGARVKASSRRGRRSYKTSGASSEACGSRALAAMRRSGEGLIAPRAALLQNVRGLERSLWEPRPRGDAALERRPHRAEDGAPTKRQEASNEACGSRALAAMRRWIESLIAPRAALLQNVRGLERSLWEPRPRGDAALDRKPHRAEGGAPTKRQGPRTKPVGAAPSRRCGAGSKASSRRGRRSYKTSGASNEACGSRALAAMRRSSEGLIAPRTALLQNVRRPRAKPVGAAPSRRCGRLSGALATLLFERFGALVYRFAQRFARFEVGHALFRDRHALA
jgi:hypothetical protein